ncbi:MAG: response regulator, partial [Gammaproteobacteria bacterium]|nr:response regulator [Gammaproteobacteria bacterium]
DADRPKHRILVADDLRDSADSLAFSLEARGHKVNIAYDGEQALQLARTLRPAIVVLDLGMPKLSGYDVCRAIRASAWGAGVTIVAQTGWGQAHDRQRTVEAGFDHHLVKPIDLDVLTALFPASTSASAASLPSLATPTPAPPPATGAVADA